MRQRPEGGFEALITLPYPASGGDLSATALIVGDDPSALRHLRRELQILWPDLQVIDEADRGTDAIAIVHAIQPDIVFLDIQMPGP